VEGTLGEQIYYGHGLSEGLLVAYLGGEGGVIMDYLAFSSYSNSLEELREMDLLTVGRFLVVFCGQDI